MAFHYRLEHQDGTPGATSPLGAGRSLRVVDVRPGGADEKGVLVVEPT